MSRIFHPFNTMLLIIFFSLHGCQQLPGSTLSHAVGSAISAPTDASNITWRGQTIQSDDLATQAEVSQTQASDAEVDETVSGDKDNLNDEQSVSEITVEANLPTPPQKLDPDIFLDKRTTHLASKLGEPKMRRKEGSVEVWQYQLSDCVIDIYFYKNAGSLLAKHTHMRSPLLGEVINREACMMNLHKFSQALGSIR